MRQVALLLASLFFSTSAYAMLSATPNPSTDGDYRVSWTAVSGATNYRLWESYNGDTFSNVFYGSGLYEDFGANQIGSYEYWVASCQQEWIDVPPSGFWQEVCTPTSSLGWSNITVTVNAGTPPTPALSGPNESFDGSVALSWGATTSATSYNLLERVGTGAWTNVYSGASLTATVSGRADNTYEYQVEACNPSGCSDPSSVVATTVENLANIEVPESVSVTNNAVGSLSFSTNVTSGGNAIVDVPIELPPGVNGMDPELRLTYNSGRVRGLVDEKRVVGTLGYGWKLNGFSEIHRCRVGIQGDLDNTEFDKLCIDGERLIHINENAPFLTYWSDGAEFRTESQSLIKIEAKGTGLVNRWFEVTLPNGRTMTYGSTANSRAVAPSNSVAYLWSLDENVDEFGNRIEYTYERNDTFGTNYPIRIDYGGYQVNLYYEIRTDTEEVQGTSVLPLVTQRAVALNSIEIEVNGVDVRQYRLDSDLSGGRLKLEQVQLCGFDEGGSNISCYYPIVFDWQELLSASDEFAVVVDRVYDSFGDDHRFFYYVMEGNATANHSYHQDPNWWFGSYSSVTGTKFETEVDRAVVYIHETPNGKSSGSRRDYYRYQGYPLYSMDGRGYLGFPSYRKQTRYVGVYNSSTSTSIDRYLYTHYQVRMDFPFIGRVARKVEEGQSVGTTVRDINRYEYGWEAQSMFAGEVMYPYLARSYHRKLNLRSTGSEVAYSGKETEFSYCFIPLSGTVCPTSGAELEYPTQVRTITRMGKELGSIDYGSVWGEVGDRSVTSQLRMTEEISSFENDASSWILGFVSEHQLGSGKTSLTIFETTQFSKEFSDSLKLGVRTKYPTDPVYDQTSTFDYDASGNLTSTTLNGTNVTSRSNFYASFLDNRYPLSTTNAESHQASHSYDRRFGSPKRYTDPNQNEYKIVRDQFGRVIEEERPDGTTITTAYEDCASLCNQVTWAIPRYRIVRTINNGSKVAPSERVYIDAAGQTVLTEREAFEISNGWIRQEVHYDNIGRVVRESLPYFSIGESPVFTDFYFDYQSRLVKILRPDSSETTFDFVGTYGNLEIVHEESGSNQKKRTLFNALGDLVESEDGYLSSDAVTTTYTYTARGRLNRVYIEGVEVADLDYDVAGNRTRLDEPTVGYWRFTYDALNQLIQVRDAKSQRTQYGYDGLGRLTSRIDGYLGSNPETSNWVWDTALNGIGQLTSQSNSFHTQTHSYDSVSRISSIVNSINVPGYPGNGTYTMSQSFDAAGRLSTETYPNSQTVSYSYNSRGYLSSLSKNGTVLHTIDGQNAFSQTIEESFGNGLKTIKEFEADTMRLNSIETGTSTLPSSIQDLLYEWEENGSLKSRTDRRGTTSSSDDRVESFEYDSLNRLELASTSGSSRDLTNTYDEFSNLTSKVSDIAGDLDATGYIFGENDEPHKLTAVTIGGVSNALIYDSNGSVTRYNAATGDDLWITYDALNRAKKITKGTSSATTSPTARDEFWYGPTERIVRRESWWDGGIEEAWTLSLFGGKFEQVHPVFDSTISFRQRVQLSDAVLNVYSHTGSVATTSVFYTHRDNLGSVNRITNSAAVGVGNRVFDPFGGRRSSDWSSDIDQSEFLDVLTEQYDIQGRGFTDHEHLNRTGIVNMNGRIYDPRIGRFLQGDPIVSAPGTSLDFNRYAYAWNSPLTVTDPTGYAERDGKKKKNNAPGGGFLGGGGPGGSGGSDSGGGTGIPFGSIQFRDPVTTVIGMIRKLGSFFKRGDRGFNRPNFVDGGLRDFVADLSMGPVQFERENTAEVELFLASHLARIRSNPSSYLPVFSDNTVNYLAGVGDAITFGLGSMARDVVSSNWIDLENTVDSSSLAYSAGEWTSIAAGGVGVYRLSYMGAAKLASRSRNPAFLAKFSKFRNLQKRWTGPALTSRAERAKIQPWSAHVAEKGFDRARAGLGRTRAPWNKLGALSPGIGGVVND